MDNKSKVGLANLLSLVSICLIICGVVLSIIVGLEDGAGTSFLMCLVGTVLHFTASYMRDGYIKFFN